MMITIEIDDGEYLNYLYDKTTHVVKVDNKLLKNMKKNEWYKKVFNLGLEKIDEHTAYKKMYKEYKNNKIEND